MSAKGQHKGPPAQGAAAPLIFVPRYGREIRFDDWYWKELREGGMLRHYLAREKAQTRQRMIRGGRRYRNFRQNNKSELELKAIVDARTFLRWKAQDSHFWEDPSNVKSFVKDNPEARPWRA